MKINKFFSAIIIASLSFVACDTNNASDGTTCTVTYDATSLSVYQSVSGMGTYQVKGLYRYNGIYNEYVETFSKIENANSRCDKLKNGDWYENVECSGNTITYEDYNEMTIEEEAMDFQEMCDDFLASYE